MFAIRCPGNTSSLDAWPRWSYTHSRNGPKSTPKEYVPVPFLEGKTTFHPRYRGEPRPCRLTSVFITIFCCVSVKRTCCLSFLKDYLSVLRVHPFPGDSLTVYFVLPDSQMTRAEFEDRQLKRGTSTVCTSEWIRKLLKGTVSQIRFTNKCYGWKALVRAWNAGLLNFFQFSLNFSWTCETLGQSTLNAYHFFSLGKMASIDTSCFLQ